MAVIDPPDIEHIVRQTTRWGNEYRAALRPHGSVRVSNLVSKKPLYNSLMVNSSSGAGRSVIRLLGFICSLAAAVYVMSRHGNVSLGRDSSAWLEAYALLMVGVFLLEPIYSSATTALTNAVAVLFASLKVADPGPFYIWYIVAGLCLVSLSANITSYILRERASTFVKQLKKTSIYLGSARIAVLTLLIASLVSFNVTNIQLVTEVALLTLAVLVVRGLDPAEIFTSLIDSRRPAQLAPVGVHPPFDLFAVPRSTRPKLGEVVRLQSETGDAQGQVVGETVVEGRPTVRIACRSLYSVLPPDGLADLHVSRLSTGDATAATFPGADSDKLIGYATRGTTPSLLKVEVTQHEFPLEVHDPIHTLSGGVPVAWQVDQIELTDSTWGGPRGRVVQLTASQLGMLEPDTGRYLPALVAPQLCTAVMAGDGIGEEVLVEPPGPDVFEVGAIPSTGRRVFFDLHRIVLHHCLITGPTGAGKTTLASRICESLVNDGSRVVLVQMSYGDSMMLAGHDQPIVTTARECLSTESKVVRYVPKEDSDVHADVGEFLSGLRDQIAPTGTSERVRIAVVLDEAYRWIPQTTSHSIRATIFTIKDARKWGIGFLICSDRTEEIANAAVENCNSRFAVTMQDGELLGGRLCRLSKLVARYRPVTVELPPPDSNVIDLACESVGGQEEGSARSREDH